MNCRALLLPCVSVVMTVYGPLALSPEATVPEISPLLLLIDTPDGKPLA